MKVKDLMTRDPVTVGEHHSLKEAAEIMTAKGVSGLPVVDDSGKLVGIITEADFVERASAEDRASIIGALFDRRKLAADTVGKAMSRNVVTVDPNATHNVAAGLMKRKSVKRLPVVDDSGDLIGILSRGDILGVYARPDAEIAHELTDRIIGRVMALEPGAVAVEVTDGAVVLEGTVPTRTEADLLEDLAPTVAGVISVDSRVGYRVDDTRRADEPRPAGVPRPNW